MEKLSLNAKAENDRRRISFLQTEVIKTRKYKYLTYEQRRVLGTMHKHNIPLPEISRALDVHIATVYRELKRGGAEKPGDTYDPDVAENAIRESFSKRGKACA